MLAQGKPTKKAILISILALLLCAYLYRPTWKLNKNHSEINRHILQWDEVPQGRTRYILKWGDPNLSPLDFMGKGSSAFIRNGCEYTNCYVTDDKAFLPDVSKFDAIVFNGRDMERHLKKNPLPQSRSPKQKYVYANMESSHNYPVCNSFFNDYFNWTWTYKLNSDSRWGYFTVYNASEAEVGPRVDMHWPELDPIDNATKMLLGSKSKAAAWFVSNCYSLSGREHFARLVAEELHKLGHSLDIYGNCGKFRCPRSNSEACFKILAKDYYFYFAFENSLAEDYVTEKVVTALNNYAVPVVLGAANYSWFLPPGSYLNGVELGAKELAERMAAIISNHRDGDSSMYYDFFRWRNHYTYKITFENADVCKLCKLLNDSELMSKESVYRNFTGWWNSPRVKCRTRKKRSKTIAIESATVLDRSLGSLERNSK